MLWYVAPPTHAARASDIRVSVRAEADSGLTSKLVSLVSKEIRHLDRVLLVEEQPQYHISCSVITVDLPPAKRVGYAVSVVVTLPDNRLLMHFVHVDNSLESLAHEVALTIDGGLFERARRSEKSALSPR
jgi:hypothetical protein